MKMSGLARGKLDSLHPDVKRQIRQAIDDVAAGKKRDTKALGGMLEGFHRLRVGRWRTIYRFATDTGEMIVEFIEDRGSVYEDFEPGA